MKTTESMSIFRCDGCSQIMPAAEILHPLLPPHPKTGEQESVPQCPFCGCVEEFTNICDEPNCKSVAGCGAPSDIGYRRTCGVHYNGSAG